MANDEIAMILEETELKMEEVVEHLEKELGGIRTGKANPTILNKLTIEYYGVETLVNQVASISVSEAQTIMIKPYDKSSLSAIEKAVYASDLGLTPNNNGEVIRLVVPSLTEERRKSLAKDIKDIGEKYKVIIRNHRRNANDLIKKIDVISKDEVEFELETVQKMTDKFIQKLESVVTTKEKEVQTI